MYLGAVIRRCIMVDVCCVFVLMIRRPPRSTRTDTLFPYTTLFRSIWLTLTSSELAIPSSIPRASRVGLVTNRSSPTSWQRSPIRSVRSEEHTSELQSLMRISYAVFCLKKKKQRHKTTNNARNQHAAHIKKQHVTEQQQQKSTQ